jgi:hypothetical protein
MHDLVAENREDTSVGIVMDPEIDKAYLTLYAAIVERKVGFVYFESNCTNTGMGYALPH